MGVGYSNHFKRRVCCVYTAFMYRYIVAHFLHSYIRKEEKKNSLVASYMMYVLFFVGLSGNSVLKSWMLKFSVLLFAGGCVYRVMRSSPAAEEQTVRRER